MVKSKNEIPILDNLRAIAAWSVCLYHFICTTTGFIDHNSLVYSCFSFGQYGVHLFFIISGLVIPWSLYYSNYKLDNFFKFFIKRLIRLEPPYIVSVLLMLMVLFLRKYSPVYNNADIVVTFKQVLLHIGYLIPFFKDMHWVNNVYWTLAIEFQYYLVIGLLYFLFTSKRSHVRLCAYIIIAGISIILPNADFLPYRLPIFGIGILIFLYKSNHIAIIELLFVSLIFLADIFIFNEKIAFIITTVSEVIILLLFDVSNKALTFIGKFSYSVYLLHAIIGAAFVNFLSHYASSVSSKVIVVIAGLIVTFCSSYLMYIFIEKPSKKLSSKLAYKKEG